MGFRIGHKFKYYGKNQKRRLSSDKDAEYLKRNGYPVVKNEVDITSLFDVFDPSNMSIIHEAIGIDIPITGYRFTK